MKQKDTTLILTATVAGVIVWKHSRLPKLKFTYSKGIVAGIDYVWTAYGNKLTGTVPLDAAGIAAYPKGGYNFVIEPGADEIFFTLYDAAGKAIFLRAVPKTPPTA
jgi:hypothetical protein